MELSAQQTDRAAGVLLGQACGDALGVPYEFAAPPVAEPEMRGGGLGPYAPGEWSDDTQMAVCIARVTATGADLTSPDALDAVAQGFEDWVTDGASDVGTQTRAVLGAARRSTGPSGERLATASRAYTASHPRSAGNGALMRTSIVGLTRLDDRDQVAASARAIAELTHADPLAGDSCVLWSEAVRLAVTTGQLSLADGLDLVPGDRREFWASRIDDATGAWPGGFNPNGYTVSALQAAWAAITSTDHRDGSPLHLQRALTAAVQAGNDTDTVAAIAGGLLGARYGASAVPVRWRRFLHGWPGLRGHDLVALALRTAHGGQLPHPGWPDVRTMQAGSERRLGIRHPHDPGVLIGTLADLHRAPELGVDAVVSLCRLGNGDRAAKGVRPTDHIEMWLLDSADPAANAHLDFVLDQAADAVSTLRAEGRRVLLHCVNAEQRAPSVALRYAVRLGVALDEARATLRAALPHARGRGLLWDVAGQVGPPGGRDHDVAERT